MFWSRPSHGITAQAKIRVDLSPPLPREGEAALTLVPMSTDGTCQ
jgi:hypothetical protein